MCHSIGDGVEHRPEVPLRTVNPISELSLRVNNVTAIKLNSFSGFFLCND